MVEESGVALLLVEQQVRLALGLTTDVVVLERGRVAHQGSSPDLLADPVTLGRLVALSPTTV